jgi:hypothetical protein
MKSRKQVTMTSFKIQKGNRAPLNPEFVRWLMGVRDRVERLKISRALRGYGNAIIPPLAAEFVVASLESIYEQKRQNY